MKTITYILALFLTSFQLSSKNLEKEIPDIKKIETYGLYGDLKITGNNSKKIEIEVTGYKEKPTTIKIKPNAKYKTDNTQLGLNFEYMENTLIITATSKKSEFGNYVISIPKNMILKLDNNYLSPSSNYIQTDKIRIDEAGSEIIIKNMKNEIDMSVFHSKTKIANIEGPVILSAFGGEYDINYTKFAQENPNVINVKDGSVALQLPFDTKANVQLNSENGVIRTDFIIKNATAKAKNKSIKVKKVTTNKIKNGNYTSIEGELNKGGNLLSISTTDADIKLTPTQLYVPVIVNP